MLCVFFVLFIFHFGFLYYSWSNFPLFSPQKCQGSDHSLNSVAFGIEADDIVNFVYKRTELGHDLRAAEHAARASEDEREAHTADGDTL